ncbi:MAG TPA: hypothetical protein VIY48_01190 [Candidatus Paceibacterota bacterium]
MGTPVSGPGQFSQRTDLPNAKYGENKDYQEQKAGAPMAKDAGTTPPVDFASLFGNPASQVVPMNAPTNQPGTPVTDGAALGAGAGTAALGLPDQKSEDMKALIPALPVLEFMANQPGASWAMRNYVRQIKAQT